MIRNIISEILKIVRFEISQNRLIRRQAYIRRRLAQGKPVRCRNRSELAYVDLVKWSREKKEEDDEWLIDKLRELYATHEK